MTNRNFLGTAATGAALVTLAAALVFLAAGAGPAEAAFPGQNGKIVYTGTRLLCDPRFCWDDLDYDDDIYAVNPDGSGQTNLTNSPNTVDRYPTFSPDGERIAFVRDGDVHVMNADGSGVGRLTDYLPFETRSNNSYAEAPAWSPDGERIVFVGRDEDPGGKGGVSTDVHVINADGTGDTRVTRNGDAMVERDPAWSYRGKIAFAGSAKVDGYYRDQYIYTTNADGSGVRRLTGGEPTDNGHPEWSPDGTKLAYQGGRVLEDGWWHFGTVVMDADGSDKTFVGSGDAFSPDGEKMAAGGDGGIYVTDAEGGGEPTRITDAGEGGYSGDEEYDTAPDWQPVCPCPDPPPPDAGPILRPLRPTPGSEIRDRTPAIKAVVRDEEGELVRADVRLYMDGRAKGFSYDPKTDRLSRATGKLSYGRHHVKIVATDGTGNRAVREWSFRVVKDGWGAGPT